MHDTRICCIKAQSLSDPFVLSMSCLTHLYPDRTDCDRVQRSVIRTVDCWISEQFSRFRKSSRTRVHQHASSFTLCITYIIKVVAEQVLQSAECLGRKDRNLAVLIQFTCSCQEEQLAVVESSRHHNREHQQHV